METGIHQFLFSKNRSNISVSTEGPEPDGVFFWAKNSGNSPV